MVDKELTITESYDLHVAKKDPESRRSIKTFLEIISNLTDRLSELKNPKLVCKGCGKCLDCLGLERRVGL